MFHSITLFSIIWALNSSGLIVSIFGAASNMSSAPLVGVMYLTVFCKKNRTGVGMFAGLCFGVLVGVACSYWIPGVSAIPSGGSIFAMLGTMLVGYVVSLFTKGPGNKNVPNDPFGEEKEKQLAKGSVMTATANGCKSYTKGQLFASALFPFLAR